MLLKNENASIRLDFVSYEFPETEYGMDEYDKNWRNCAAPGWMRMAIPIRIQRLPAGSGAGGDERRIEGAGRRDQGPL